MCPTIRTRKKMKRKKKVKILKTAMLKPLALVLAP